MTLNSDAPSPLVPACVDLRTYDWFPFFHKRLRGSAFWKRASDLACRISVDLWSESYEQVPAGSVPDDDHTLAEWAGFGRRDLAGWTKVKAEVMSAWVLCSDGRWYHPTLSEVACKAWVERRQRFWSKECERIRKVNIKRQKDGQPLLEIPPKPSDDAFVSGHGSDEGDGEIDRSDGNQEPSGGKPDVSSGNPAAGADFPLVAPGGVAGNPAENALIEKEKASFSLRSKDAGASAALPAEPIGKLPRSRRAPKPGFPTAAFEVWYDGYPHKVGRAAAEKAFERVFNSGQATLDQLVAGRDAYIATKPPDRNWCNPATWLNESRWLDKPAKANGGGTGPSNPSSEPRLDLGGGIHAPYSTIRSVWSRGQWLSDWGPKPTEPGCRVPADTMAQIMGKAA